MTRTHMTRTTFAPNIMNRALQMLRDRLDARRVLDLEQSPFAVL